MKLLQQTVLRDHYDVLVVGAGLGGVTAASLLARRGLSVLMIDQQQKPGGACTSFKHKDVVFDVGEAMLYGFSEKGFNPFHFLMNELDEPIDVIAHPTLARMTIEGRPHIFWPDVDRFVEDLVELYPLEKEGLRNFYSELYSLYEHIVIKNKVVVPPSEFSRRQLLRSLLPNPFKTLKMQKLLTTSTLSLLKRYFYSEEVIDFFDKLCSAYCYCTAAETPAVLAATMFLDNHIGGVYYAAGGAQMLPNKIEKAFERDDGDTIYGVLVDEILIHAGTAYGVRLEDGREILADRVIANATVWNIYGKLVRPEHIPPKRLAWAQALVPTYPSMTLYMTVDREAFPEDILPWEVFIENREEIDSGDLTLYINSLVDETLGPPGQMVIMAISPNLCEWPSPDDPEYRSAAYYAQKNQEVQRMLDQIEGHYPGFKSHINTLIAGTPTTIERYLLKNRGAVGGPKNMIGQEMLKRLHARSEWNNLYICGDSTVMATGAPAATVSGVGAANMVLRDLRKQEYDSRKIEKSVVNFVDLPYRRRQVGLEESLGVENACLYAAQCQWCEEPACAIACPAGIDIPGFLRRMEAKNYIGAARVIRRRNPLGEVCGSACQPNPRCENECFRATFSDWAVRISELQQWVCQNAGKDGWLAVENQPNQRKIIVVGTDPTAMTCAYYLALIGNQVELFGEGSDLTESLHNLIGREDVPYDSVERDLTGILKSGIQYYGGEMNFPLHPITWMQTYQAAIVSEGHLDVLSGPIWDWPGLFTLKEFPEDIDSVVSAAAEGRRTAEAVDLFLG